MGDQVARPPHPLGASGPSSGDKEGGGRSKVERDADEEVVVRLEGAVVVIAWGS